MLAGLPVLTSAAVPVTTDGHQIALVDCSQVTYADAPSRLSTSQQALIEMLDDRMRLTKLGLIWHTNVILEFFNPAFWGDTDSLSEANWSLNGVMVEVGAISQRVSS